LQFTAKEWQDVTLIPNGADPDRVTPRKGRKLFREELGVGDHEKLVLCASRIMPDKNISFLVDAVAELESEYKLCLVGPQMHYSAQEVARWERLLGSRLIIRPEVHHIGDYLASADCFALASLSEAHPLAVTEAWLAGLPVAMFCLPWVEWVKQQHGLMVYDCPLQFKNDPQAFALNIFRASRDQQGLARKAQAIAWQSYSSSAMAARWEGYLGQLSGISG
jgi:glycosyltransferase involved in cell wall biosynthesis